MKNKKSIVAIIFLFLNLNFIFSQSSTLHVTQLADNKFAVAVASVPYDNEIDWSTTPDTWSKTKFQLKTITDTFTVEAAKPIFRIETERKKYYYASARPVQLEGAVNFRDLGGYLNKDGKQVKWGKIYR